MCLAAACGQPDAPSSPASAVKQACTYTVSATFDPNYPEDSSGWVPLSGGTFTAQVHRASGDCAWQASTDANAEVVGATTGTGDGTFAFQIPPTPTDRTGSVGIRWTGGMALVNFRQTTVACALGAGLPRSFDVDAKGGSFSYQVALHASCSFLGVSDADWLSSTRTDTNIAAGYLRFVIAANPSPTPRVGNLSILAPFQTPVTVTFTQAGD